MEVMNEITTSGDPDRLVYSNARWRISQASFQRRKLWVDCYRHLRPLVSGSDLTKLESLRLADMELQRSSAAHVERWRPECLQREWAAYCQASSAIRARMNTAIELEKRLLYPLLARYSAHRSGRSLP